MVYLQRFVLLLFTLGLTSSCQNKIAENHPKVIIDADTANEVDDLFALVRAIIEPSIDLIAISSAQFHISPLATDSTVIESQELNETLLHLLDIDDILLPIGANGPISHIDNINSTEATDLIINQAHDLFPTDTLDIVILGSCTNVASAIRLDTSIIPKIRVHYLGFWHDQVSNQYDKKEFNSGNDTLAVNYLLSLEKLNLSVMTATTSQHLVFNKTDTEFNLRDKGDLGAYLMNRWENYDRWWTSEDSLKTKWIMWDVAIIQALIHPSQANKKRFLCPSENGTHEIDIYTEIDVKLMNTDYWSSLDQYYKLKD